MVNLNENYIGSDKTNAQFENIPLRRNMRSGQKAKNVFAACEMALFVGCKNEHRQKREMKGIKAKNGENREIPAKNEENREISVKSEKNRRKKNPAKYEK